LFDLRFGFEQRRSFWCLLIFAEETIGKKNFTTKANAPGFSDDVWVFVSGQMAYLDKNIYSQVSMRKYRIRKI
jgi:hypothetical protein